MGGLCAGGGLADVMRRGMALVMEGELVDELSKLPAMCLFTPSVAMRLMGTPRGSSLAEMLLSVFQLF